MHNTRKQGVYRENSMEPLVSVLFSLRKKRNRMWGRKMDLYFAFLAFGCAIIACLSWEVPLSAGVFVGLLAFMLTGCHQGYSLRSLLGMVYRSRKTSLLVCQILFFIGCLTALWRSSGTIAYFVYYGIQLVTPHFFLVLAFLLSAALSFALGSSFGTVVTAGVMLMALARSGNVDVLMTAGAILSGAFVGERCAPASSAALLISSVTGVDHKEFIKKAIKIGSVPFMLSLLFFLFLSWTHPIQQVDERLLLALEQQYQLSWLTMIPAVVLLVLPWLGLRIVHVVMLSGLAAFLVAIGVQHQSLLGTLVDCIAGYQETDPLLQNILSGGGALSMLNVMCIIFLSNGCVGVFRETGMLHHIQDRLYPLMKRMGFFEAQIVLAVFLSSVFCNQTLGITLSTQLTSQIYEEHSIGKDILAADLNNSIVTIAALIPWSVACALPLSVMHVNAAALLYSVWLYLVPLSFIFTRSDFFHITTLCPEDKAECFAEEKDAD